MAVYKPEKRKQNRETTQQAGLSGKDGGWSTFDVTTIHSAIFLSN
jgi:hypothetical protein